MCFSFRNIPAPAIPTARFIRRAGIGPIRGKHSPVVVIAANALEAQRLVEEIPFFAPELRVHLLPDWETLPYDHFSPHQDLISERLATLHHVAQPVVRCAGGAGDHRTVSVAAGGISGRVHLLPQARRKAGSRQTARADDLAGYSHVQQVLSPGEYCVRGGIIDLFPMGSVVPYRIDLFDDEIETIATFDVDTQRTLYPVPEIRLLPAREFPLDEAGQAALPPALPRTLRGRPSRSQHLQGRQQGHRARRHRVLPAAVLRTYRHPVRLPAETCHAVPASRRGRGHRASSPRTRSRATTCCAAIRSGRCWKPQNCSSRTRSSSSLRAKHFARLDICRGHQGDRRHAAIRCPTAACPTSRSTAAPKIRTQASQHFLQITPGRVLLLADSLGRREIIAGYLNEYGLTPAPCDELCRSSSPAAKIHARRRAAAKRFRPAGRKHRARHRNRTLRRATAQPRRARREEEPTSKACCATCPNSRSATRWCMSSTASPLSGLVNLDLGEGENEFLLLEYAGDDKLYVPVAQLHVISRYSGGAPEAAPLHKLGTRPWEKAKRRADAAGARHRRRIAQSLCTARHAQGPCVQVRARTTTKRSPKDSVSRKHPTRPPPSTR